MGGAENYEGYWIVFLSASLIALACLGLVLTNAASSASEDNIENIKPSPIAEDHRILMRILGE